jgi:hypothetical protein
LDRRKIVVLHIRGYTDTPEKAIEKTQVRMPAVKNFTLNTEYYSVRYPHGLKE